MKFTDKIRFVFGNINQAPPKHLNMPAMDPHIKVVEDCLAGKPIDPKVLKACMVELVATLVAIENWSMFHKFRTEDMPRWRVYDTIKHIRNLMRP